MINGKEIAKLIRKSNNVIIEKFENGSYNVTDTYIMVILNEAEFGKFFAKYNSYKTTADIPFNFEGTISSIGKTPFKEDKLNTKTVTSQIGNAKHEAVITDFYKKKNRKSGPLVADPQRHVVVVGQRLFVAGKPQHSVAVGPNVDVHDGAVLPVGFVAADNANTH